MSRRSNAPTTTLASRSALATIPRSARGARRRRRADPPHLPRCDHLGGGAERYAANATFVRYSTKDIDRIRTTIDDLLKAKSLPRTIAIDNATALYKARCDRYGDRYNTEAQRDIRAFVDYLLALPCHVVITALEKPIYATPGTKIDLVDGSYVVKANDTIAIGYRADTDDSFETHADTILRFVRDDMTESYSAIALRDRGAHLTPWQRFDEICATDILKTLAPPPKATSPSTPAAPATTPPPTTIPDAAAKRALHTLVERYNILTTPKKMLTLSALLAKYPEPEKARAALTAAIQQAGGENAAAQAEAPATATRAAAGNGRKLGFPAHLA